MRNLYKQLAFGLIAATSPLAMQAQVEVPDTVYKQLFTEKVADCMKNTMTVIDADGSSKTWGNDTESGNGYAVNIMAGTIVDADDWLITPDIALEAGRLYILSYKAYSPGAGYPDDYAADTNRLTALVGQGTDYTTYTALTKDPKLKAVKHYLEYREYIHNTEAGNYRVAFNDKSPKNCFPTRLDDVFLIKGPLLVAPDSVSNYTAEPGEGGTAKATVRFNAPTKALDGTTLTALTKIYVLRDGKVAHTFEAPQPGEALSFTDDRRLSDGYHTYEIMAVSDKGNGLRTARTVFVGVDVPAAPSGTTATDMGEKIRLSWTAPTKGANGHYIDPAKITYNLYVDTGRTGYEMVARNVSGTTYDVDNTFSGDQTQTNFRVSAVSSAGESRSVAMPEIILGAPYELPFSESFAAGRPELFWWRVESDSWNKFRYVKSEPNTLGARPGADGDYGYAIFEPYDDDETTELNTGKIKTEGTTQPTLKFAYSFSSTTKGGKVEVVVAAPNKGEKVVYTATPSTTTVAYRNASVDLSEYKTSPYIFVKFRATSNVGNEVSLDNISINDGNFDTDLNVKSSAVAQMVGGEHTTVNARIANIGNNKVSSYTVDLLADGKVVDSKAVTTPLKAMKSAALAFDYKAPVDKEQVTLTVKVSTEGDQNPGNDTSAPLTISLSAPVLTAPTALQAHQTATGASLNWTAPAASDVKATEGFEDYEPFNVRTDNIGPWQLVDGDQSWTQGIPLADNIYEVVAYPGGVEEDAFAWMVFDPTLTTPNVEELYDGGQFTPHGGKQYAIAACATDIATTATTNDDWLISPLLNGEEQTIDFWAMSPSTMAENFEVYASKKSDDTDDFELVKADVTGTNHDGWKQFSYQLPAGSKYFAVRYNSYNEFMMGIDDITYTTGDGTLKGYNIYRDGELLTTTDASTTNYDDATAGTDDHVYSVTAVYTRGESVKSNAAGVGTGIDNVSADSIGGTATYYDLGGRRIASAPQRGVFVVRKADGTAVKVTRK